MTNIDDIDIEKLFQQINKNCTSCKACIRCDTCKFCYMCHGCKQCLRCVDCISCKKCLDCFDCAGLNNAQYCWNNQQLSKDEYLRRCQQHLICSQDIDADPYDRFINRAKMFSIRGFGRGNSNS